MQTKICTRCVMDTTDPDITFDGDGVCNHCYEYIQKEKIRRGDATNLPWVYYRLREAGKGNSYDCLLGLSGGVDSSLCLHYLVENGIRPLCFSIDNGWNTSEADENVMRLVEGMKVPFYRYTIDIQKFRELQIAFIKSGTANIEVPTDHILMAATYEMAHKYNIKWIISGGNLATESIMPKAWGYHARDLKFLKSVYKQFTQKKIVGLPLIWMRQYLLCRFIRGIKFINLLDYYEYNRDQAKKLLSEKYGWKDYQQKHEESLFTKWFQNCYLIKKFGIDKRKAHFSSLINSGQMTREFALQELQKEPPCILPLIASKFNVSEGEIQSWLKLRKKSYKDYPNSEWLWELLSKIYGQFKIKRN